MKICHLETIAWTTTETTINYDTRNPEASVNNHGEVSETTEGKRAKKAAKASVASLQTSHDIECCSPPLQKNGAKKTGHFILTVEEQKAYKKYSVEVKQISALIVLKCGLGIAEGPVQTQIIQEESFCTKFESVYNLMAKNVIIG